ncbi:hypothetical protein B0H63DRAFT_146392 [Podospora didyma]|uniref:Myb-like DNA-binding domain-containing protein n=1 Tax=Podospora didyma TaxID=330526 RepID=A0AAE0U1E8_9PEZI|nr:hypothetical protein B0H63DRAFT_146392 [Podospora didyma]
MPTKASKNVAAAGEIGPNGQKQPSPAEAYLFFTIIKNMRTKPDIDWQGVANDNNFKNAETAKVRYGQIKRKLGFSDSSGPPRGDTNNASDGNGPSTPSSKKGGITPSSGGAATASGGVKKAPRARKPSAAKQAKTDAIVKGRYKSQATIAPAEDEEDDEERVTYCVEHNDDDEDVEMANTPTRKPTKASIKREMGASYSSSSFAAPKKEDDKVQLMSIAPAAGAAAAAFPGYSWPFGGAGL